MARSTSLRRKPARLLVLYLAVVVLAFISNSVIQRSHRRKISIPFQSHDEDELTLFKQSNGTSYHRRFLRVEQQLPANPDNNYRIPLNMAQFVDRVNLEGYPGVHPSRPYYVNIDNMGQYVKIIEDGHRDHPLNRLVDLRVPREGEPILFFVVPKVNHFLLQYVFNILNIIHASLLILLCTMF